MAMGMGKHMLICMNIERKKPCRASACMPSSRPSLDYRWPNGRPGTSLLRHELINGPCRVCPWTELPAQARSEGALSVSDWPFWLDSPVVLKMFPSTAAAPSGRRPSS